MVGSCWVADAFLMVQALDPDQQVIHQRFPVLGNIAMLDKMARRFCGPRRQYFYPEPGL
jgi:hypothetical protein